MRGPALASALAACCAFGCATAEHRGEAVHQASSVAATQSSEGASFVEEFLAIMEQHSMFAVGPDWAQIKHDARRRAASSADALSTYAILEQVINAVGDEHGGLNVSDERTAEYQRRYGGLWYELTSRRPNSAFMDRERPEVHDELVAGRLVRTLVAPRVFMNEDEQTYARALFEATANAPENVCGFVLDLRGNIGGDMWPMLSGLSPLLGDGEVGAFTSRTEPAIWRIDRGRAGAEAEGGFQLANWSPPQRDMTNAAVALVLDDGVLSSGEAVAVAFSGRPHTRSFGAKTYGLSTANSPFELSDGTTLYIATGVYRDRDGKDFPHGVEPDEGADPAGELAPAIQAARRWLAQQPSCQA